MRICFVRIFRVNDPEHLDFLGNILLRTLQVLGQGFDIHFIYEGTATSPYLLDKGIKLHRYGDSLPRILMSATKPFILIQQIYKVCREEQIDIVLNLSGHHFLFLICIGARLAGKKCMARVVGMIPVAKSMPLKRKIKKEIGRWFERLSLHLADRVICLSESLKYLLLERGNREDKISVISQGVDLDFFKPRPLKKIKARPRRVLFVGRLVKNKGLDEGIEAFLKAKNEHNMLEFIICGHGPEKQRLTEKWLARRDIIFKGFVYREQLPGLYSSSDILLLPSYSEGLPNVVMEAMASKLPVIATNIGELPQLLGEERGILVAPGDTEGLARAINKMIRDQDFRLICTQKAFDYISTNHSFEVVRGATIELFKSYVSVKEKNCGNIT